MCSTTPMQPDGGALTEARWIQAAVRLIRQSLAYVQGSKEKKNV